jgi:uncharacterized protein (DUF2164 family)
MVFPQNFNRIYNNIIEYFLLDKYDIFINLNQTDKLDNLNKNNIYNKIIYYKYDNIENIEIKSNFNIFSRKFASKYLDYYYYNHGQIDMKKLIKEYNLSVITAKI